MHLELMLLEWLTGAAGWAWHTSLVVLPAMALLLGLGRWHSFPARWRLVLAAVVAVRLLLPTVPAITWHPWNPITATLVTTPPERLESSVSKDPLSDERTSFAEPETEAVTDGKRLGLAMVWFSGVLLTAGWAFGSHLHLRSLILSRAQPSNDALCSALSWSRQRMGVRQSLLIVPVEGLPTMAIWGWLSPRLLVPPDAMARYTQAELRGMLLHELAHLRRRDGLWIWFGLAACALHWFNPLVWLCLRRYLADRELECDRAALQVMPEADRLSYGHALLKTLGGDRAWSFATCIPFSRHHTLHELKHRMTMIAHPLASRWGRLAALVSVPLLALGTLTTAADEAAKEPSREPATRDGEGDSARKTGPRDGEGRREGPRDGDARKEGPRDGDARKEGPRDGELKRSGPRDGEARKEQGARDGDSVRNSGDREAGGESRKSPERDGGVRKSAEGDGGGRKSVESGDEANMGEGRGRPANPANPAVKGQPLVVTVNAEGNVVNSKAEVIDLRMVRGRMKDIADQNPGQSVILRAAADTPHAKVMAVLDAFKDSGLKNVTMDVAP